MAQQLQKELLIRLKKTVEEGDHYMETLSRLPASTLQKVTPPFKWNLIALTEHLNSYCRYYLPVIKSKIEASSLEGKLYYKSGWLGNYFTQLMKGKSNGSILKMKSPAEHDYSGKTLSAAAVFHEFAAHQKELMQLLEASEHKSLEKIKIPVSISRFIRLQLGDTFQFLIAHQERHFKQAEKMMDAMNALSVNI